MISKHFSALELGGHKWDRGMTLFEFDALREPEKTQWPQIGEYLRSLGFEFNEVTPQMLWCGHFHPDLYIANRLDSVPDGWHSDIEIESSIKDKREWSVDYDLYSASIAKHGEKFHNAFIEPMAQKILGIPTTEICAKYHRAAWVPLYWPQTLREKKSLPTKFYYPKRGYAGFVTDTMTALHLLRNPSCAQEGLVVENKEQRNNSAEFDAVGLTISFILAKPTRPLQCLFVVDKSPIYRVTDMDACAGIDAPYHRFVIESRQYCQDVSEEAERLNLLRCVQYFTQRKTNMPLPSLANVRRGWKPAPSFNQQLWSLINAEAHA